MPQKTKNKLCRKVSTQVKHFSIFSSFFSQFLAFSNILHSSLLRRKLSKVRQFEYASLNQYQVSFPSSHSVRHQSEEQQRRATTQIHQFQHHRWSSARQRSVARRRRLGRHFRSEWRRRYDQDERYVSEHDRAVVLHSQVRGSSSVYGPAGRLRLCCFQVGSR